MPEVSVGLLGFSFQAGWHVSQYDTWAFYRRRFINTRDKTKAVDVIAIGPDRTAYLIAVKDYRRHQRTKPIDLADEVVSKVCDTLAALLPARLNGDVAQETDFAQQLLEARRLRIVLHLEQPVKHSKLFPRAIDPANVRQKLRQRAKAIDAHPLVVERHAMGALPWRVT